MSVVGEYARYQPSLRRTWWAVAVSIVNQRQIGATRSTTELGGHFDWDGDRGGADQFQGRDHSLFYDH